MSSSSTTNTVKTTIDSQSTAQIDSSSSVKIDSKPLSSLTKEFRPRTETNQQLQSQKQQQQQTTSIEEQKITASINKDNIPIQQSTPVVPVPVKREAESVPSSAPLTPAVHKVDSSLPTSSIPVSTTTGESSVAKNISTSPSRRKTTGQQQPQATGVASTGVTTSAPSVTTPVVADSVGSSVPEPPKEQKEQTVSETSGVSSRGATPTPQVNQAEHYQKNGENSGDKSEGEKSTDGELIFFFILGITFSFFLSIFYFFLFLSMKNVLSFFYSTIKLLEITMSFLLNGEHERFIGFFLI